MLLILLHLFNFANPIKVKGDRRAFVIMSNIVSNCKTIYMGASIRQHPQLTKHIGDDEFIFKQ